MTLTASLSLITTTNCEAADPYDQKLEARVEALERELNLVEGDKKGKNVEEDQVPTFLRAAGKQVQQLTIAGDLRFRYNYDNEDFQYPGGGNGLQRSRYIFRLRLNLNYTFSDNFYAALGVSTNSQSDAQNQPITEGFDDYAFICTSSSWVGSRTITSASLWGSSSLPSIITRMRCSISETSIR